MMHCFCFNRMCCMFTPSIFNILIFMSVCHLIYSTTWCHLNITWLEQFYLCFPYTSHNWFMATILSTFFFSSIYVWALIPSFQFVYYFNCQTFYTRYVSTYLINVIVCLNISCHHYHFKNSLAQSNIAQGRPRQTSTCGVIWPVSFIFNLTFLHTFVIYYQPTFTTYICLHLSVYFTTNCGDQNFITSSSICSSVNTQYTYLSSCQKLPTMTNMTFCKKHLLAYSYFHDNNIQMSHFMALICRLCQSQFILFRSRLSSFLTSSP